MQVIEIDNCPSTLTPGYKSYSYTALRRMFDNKTVSHVLDKDFSKKINANICETLIPGGRKKITANIIKQKIVPAENGTTGKYIIKFAPDEFSLNNLSQIPANEHLTMQIARQIYKINTAENALIFLYNGDVAYITKRFDFTDKGDKIKQEDFASLTYKSIETHGDNYKYIGTYAGLGALFKTYCAAWQIELCKFYKLIVFNYIFGNGDAHLKNFSIQQTKDGDYVLTPAYDLINTAIHNQHNDFALDGGLFQKNFYSKTYKRKGYPCIADFITFGKMIGIPEVFIEKINNEFLQENEEVNGLIERSFLSKKMKKKYLEVYQQRLKRFKTSI
ncbi:HipA domain-containing protein [Bacteroidales bacterium OttesenSCG-928-K03]|nr:HipA domain-containing protein [Odoribacter sp. OttesenSCG-928-L07]MDL2238992.1 HipA domain-containing protein [Bacteroidales bacterium OttesenSCG-928-L14]MDL2240720.1 HipA domain-containing protein [Bacteroidales bacterium OttesenSCG-928-K22]MDL2243127.1 HipA domain-containing protein [Bacteroidales bacterium OttesenSCG-928-K03]